MRVASLAQTLGAPEDGAELGSPSTKQALWPWRVQSLAVG